jgi:HK97 gp10 family phage protein
MTVQITDNLVRLKNLVPRVRAEYTAVMKEWTTEVHDEQVRMVPVKTGNLRDSLKVKKYGLSFTITVDKVAAPYYAFIEFGTKKARAFPYFYPPITEAKPRLNQMILDGLQKAVRGI